MKTLLSNSPGVDINRQIETNGGNTFDSSGGNKTVEQKVSKCQEGREINKNSWSSRDKTKSGEYVLNQPPKKPGDKEAYDINTATTVTCVTASTSEKSSQTITVILEKGKVPNIVQTEKEDNYPMTFEQMAEDTISRPYHQILFMTAKELRDRGDLL